MKEIKVGNDSRSETVLATISIDEAVERVKQQSDGKAIIIAIIKGNIGFGQNFDWIAQITSDENGYAHLVRDKSN